MFHVSQHTKATGETERSTPSPLVSTELQVQLSDVLQVRVIDEADLEILVLWTGLPQDKATWEDFAKIIAAFPDADLVGIYGR